MKEINDLPILVWPIIFSNLSIQELFNCRLVNKKFKKLSDDSESIYKLVIGEPDKDDEYYWSYDNKLIKDEDIISLRHFRIIQSLSIFNLNKNLKYLKIHDPKFKLEEVSNLIYLESLEFGCNYDSKNNMEIIDFKNLKVLSLQFRRDNFYFEINSPKLEKIECTNVNLIKFNPESIKHLITFEYDNRLEIFKNLEIIELRHNFLQINENLLSIFKELKQLKINYIEMDNSLIEIERNLIQILNEKTKLKRDIDIYIDGVKIINNEKLNEFINENLHWKFRLNNYDLLDLNLFTNYLVYDKLEQCLNNIKIDLPSSFFNKYFNLTSIKIYNVNDLNNLNWFLNNLKYLRLLDINSRQSFGEIFYTNLPSTIQILNIYFLEDINYDCILRLSRLVEFYTQCDRDLFDLALKSFRNLKYFKIFGFDFKSKSIEIEKIENHYQLRLNDENIKDNELDYNELVKACIEIKSKLNSEEDE